MGDNPIHFGTSGWRGVIAEDFTFGNLSLAVTAIAQHVRAVNARPALIVGYDTRFFSEEFARSAASILRANGVEVLFCAHAVPTPAIAMEILRRKVDGAINFTASHNPAEYNGLKLSGSDGGPALPEVTLDVENRASALTKEGAASVEPVSFGDLEMLEKIDLRGPYLERLAELVRFPAIRSANLSIAYDALHGCGAGYLDGALADHGIPVASIRTGRDVLFDGHGPDPSETNLAPLSLLVRESKAHVGLATDGDADRFGILDSDGNFVSPNHILALLFDYLVETRGWRLGAARSVATTHLMDAVARHHGLPLHQTPVGFKYIAKLIQEDQITLGGEESAGMTIRGHVPEKDGILACLLVAEMIATREQPLAEQLRALFRKVGAEFWPIRVNFRLAGDIEARLVERLRNDFSEFLGRRVAHQDRTDGLKLVLDDGSWVLLRLSGTEPLMRIYTEAASMAASKQLAQEAQEWVLQ